jgi:hypothetical protein
MSHIVIWCDGEKLISLFGIESVQGIKQLQNNVSEKLCLHPRTQSFLETLFCGTMHTGWDITVIDFSLTEMQFFLTMKVRV